MIDAFAVQDTLVSGMGKMEEIAPGLWRCTLYVTQDGEQIVAARIVGDTATVRSMGEISLRHISEIVAH